MGTVGIAVWPAPESGLGVRSWLGESARLAVRAVRPPDFPALADVPRGQGQGVLVIPGFLTSNMTTARLRNFLGRMGYRAEGWRGGVNLGPRSRVIEGLKAQVEQLSGETGGRIAVTGISLGGVYAREVAKMMPDHVAAVGTLCSPVHLPVPTPLAPLVWALQRSFDAALVAGVSGEPDMPAQPTLAVYSRKDGIVDWHACVPPQGDNVEALEIDAAGHTTIACNPAAQAALARFLARAFEAGQSLRS